MNKEIYIRGLAEFLNKYKKSNIIYPDAVKRYLNITLKETYEHLDKSSPFLCVNSSFSYIKYVYAAFIFSNVL